MATVYIQNTGYIDPRLRGILFDMLEACAGTAVQKDTHVLVKPNLLMPAKPGQGILTHPLVVRFTIEWVLEKGGRPFVSDSPAIGSFDKILKIGGYTEALSGLDVPCRPLRESIRVDIGKPFHRIELAREAVEADTVINLAKLKSHTHMLMTLGVKNTFGCVVAFKKPEWHLRSGVDRDLFARLLVQIHQAIAPSATIIDGILALQGQGPGKSGDPVRITGFDLPDLSRLTFGPKPFQGIIRKHLTQRPMVIDGRCVRCGECVSFCPAEAVTLGDPEVSFDYDRCIRCYCCVEICPHGALHAADTRPGRIVKQISRMFSPREN